MLQLPDFDTMWSTYPRGEADAVKKRIGGNVDGDWITNTCAIRLSRSFNYSGEPIPKGARGLNTIPGADGLRYAFRVREFRDSYMLKRYGPPDLVHDNDGDGGPVPESFRGVRGVICFDVKVWDDATGHLDLWNGEECAGHGYFEVARSVWLWRTGLPWIGGSVGVRGRNAPADVRIVQQLLRDAGEDPGPVDGAIGERTRAAIKRFQERFTDSPDGRIDVGGTTWNRLLAGRGA